jgi:hypothetical protein
MYDQRRKNACQPAEESEGEADITVIPAQRVESAVGEGICMVKTLSPLEWRSRRCTHALLPGV